MGWQVVKIEKLEAALQAEVRETYSEPKLEAMGKFMRDIIVNRTKEGLDADGQSFPGYSTKPIYIPMSARPVPRGGEETPRAIFGHKEESFWISAKTGKVAKAPRGKKGKGRSMFFKGGYAEYKRNIGASFVNLMCSGRMLGSMFSSAAGRVIRIAFRGDDANMKAIGNDSTRNFFGLMRIQKEVERIQAYWKVLNGQ